MSQKTSIQWTMATWNPLRGCSRVSPGCENCYAERIAGRFSTKPTSPFHGFATMKDGQARWTRNVEFVPGRLSDPLHWRKPTRVFVNSMSDLFHESISNEGIAAIFGVMAACPQHTFQVLTKRASRMREWFAWLEAHGHPNILGTLHVAAAPLVDLPGDDDDDGGAHQRAMERLLDADWPLPNVWLGVSVEDQERANARLPQLCSTPAAVRFVSYEPALGPVDFAPHFGKVDGKDHSAEGGIDWVIVGGESGPGARAFDLVWARRTIEQCRAAGVACFVKQLGSKPIDAFGAPGMFRSRLRLRDGHGGQMDEWPPGLQVREFPHVVEV